MSSISVSENSNILADPLSVNKTTNQPSTSYSIAPIQPGKDMYRLFGPTGYKGSKTPYPEDLEYFDFPVAPCASLECMERDDVPNVCCGVCVIIPADNPENPFFHRPLCNNPIMNDIRSIYATFMEITEDFQSSDNTYYFDKIISFAKLRDKEKNPKNMFSHERIEEMRKYIEKKFKFGMADYHLQRIALMKYSDIVHDYNLGEKIFEPGIIQMIENFVSRKIIPDQFLSEYSELKTICNKIKSSIIIDLPALIMFMKEIQELGLMSELLLYAIKKWSIGIEEFTPTLAMITKKREKFAEKLYKTATNHCVSKAFQMLVKTEPIIKDKTEIIINDKTKVCRLEHNKPLCQNCGWQNSWVKNFRKRGVYVKENTDGTKKDV